MDFISLFTGRFFSILGWSLMAACLAFITRSQILTVALLFAVPFVAEVSLKAACRQMGGMAAEAAHFFPFSALESITPSGSSAMFNTPGIPPMVAAGISLAYMVIAVLLSVRRA